MLQQTTEYKQRFAGNDARIKAGLAVLAPAEYLATERAYRQVLEASGINDMGFATSDQFSKWIASDVSPAEIKDRVDLAQQWVDSQDSQLRASLLNYYGIDNTHLVGYALDRTTGLAKIQQQARSAEIGAEALRQGLGIDRTQAESFASQGVTQGQARAGFAQAASVVPAADTLSQIYGRQAGVTYGSQDAVDEFVGGLASAERKRRQLAAAAQADFSGATGTARNAFQTATGQF